LPYTIFKASNLKKKAVLFIGIYTCFFYLNVKFYWVWQKNNTAFFLSRKDPYLA
jgi:hypothetical protein